MEKKYNSCYQYKTEYLKSLSNTVSHVNTSRTKVINKDDIINLRIVLETTKSVDEFLSVV